MLSLVPRRRVRPTEGALARGEYTPFDLLRREFASLFDRAFPIWPFEAPWELEPYGLTMEEKENELVLRAEFPGFEPKEVEVFVRGNEFIIKAEHTEPVKGKEVEPRHARFERTLTLPPGVEPEKIKACYRNGVLEVHIPLSPEAKPVRIEVKT